MIDNISLYLHIPFCKKKCDYCDFYSLPLGYFEEDIVEIYFDCLIKELNFYSSFFRNTTIESIYIGGGTPNSIDNIKIEKFFEKFFISLSNINKNFQSYLKETTIEINPQFVNKDQIKILKRFPFNRISLGVQSLNNNSLKFLGRNANLKETKNSIDLVLANFENVSLDFIIGFPQLKIKKEISQLKTYIQNYNSLNHFSFYILNIASGTRLYDRLNFKNNSSNKKRNKKLIDQIEIESAKQYLYICEMMAKYGFEHYEISNFAKNKNYSIHNLRYWQLKPYIGLGSLAHSFLYNLRYNNGCLKNYIMVWKNYEDIIIKNITDNLEFEKLQNIKTNNPIDFKILLLNSMQNTKRIYEVIDKTKKINEFIMLSLRIKKGLDLNELKKNFDINLLELKRNEIDELINKGYINIEENILSIKELSFLFYNSIVSSLLI